MFGHLGLTELSILPIGLLIVAILIFTLGLLIVVYMKV